MLKTFLFVGLFFTAACNSGTLDADSNNGDPQTTTPDATKDQTETIEKDMGIRQPPLDMKTDDASNGNEDTSIEDASIDMKPPEGELMLFADVLANCTPQAEPTPNCALAPPTSTGNYNIDCVNRINQFRAHCQCLPPLARWTDGEQCAAEQSKYDSDNNQAHAGFNARICNGGGGQNECPRYNSEQQVVGLCLQQMWDEGPGEPFSEHGHYINMTNARFSSVACGIYQGDNRTWAIQNFR